MIHSWFEQIAHKNERFVWKYSYFLYVFDSLSLLFPFFMPKSKSLPLLFAQSLMTKKRGEQFALFHEQITLSLFRSQKTSHLLKKLMSEFPTLILYKYLTIGRSVAGTLKSCLCWSAGLAATASCFYIAELGVWFVSHTEPEGPLYPLHCMYIIIFKADMPV